MSETVRRQRGYSMPRRDEVLQLAAAKQAVPRASVTFVVSSGVEAVWRLLEELPMNANLCRLVSRTMPPLAAVLALLHGCAREPVDSGQDSEKREKSTGSPLPPPPRVYLEPSAQATDVAETDIGVWVDDSNTSISVEQAVLDELASRLSLDSDDRGAVTLAGTEIVEHLPLRGGTEIRLKPQSELAEGWYSLQLSHLDELPQKLQLAPGESASADGSVSHRFRIGSGPAVVRANVCPSEDGTWTKFIIQISETVRIYQPLNERAEITTERGTSCTSPTTSTQYDQLSFRCDNLRVGDVVSVQLTAAFASLATPDRPDPGSTARLRFEPSNGPAESGCTAYAMSGR